MNRARRQLAAAARRACRPSLEALEARRLLATIHVTNANASGTGSLAAAVNTANTTYSNQANTIDFTGTIWNTPQTITPSGTLNLTNTSGLQTIMAPTVGVTLSGGGTQGVFNVSAGVTASINGLTITNGASTDGGGVYNLGTLTVNNCTISGNTAENGTSAQQRGGGVWNGGSVTFADSVISGNTAGIHGGGVFNDLNSTVVFTNCTLSANSAQGAGGLENRATASLTNCTIAGNSATDPSGGGGGLGNTALSLGMTVTNCTFSGNSASGTGGGVDNHNTATFTNCTFNGNSAGGAGGGLNDAGTTSITLLNTIIAGNSNSSTHAADDIAGNTINSGSNNLIGIGGSGGLPNGANGNIILSSLTDLGLAALADYGGLTQTLALLPGSPAISAGRTVSGVTADQRGLVLDSPKPDIGAFQSAGFTIAVVSGSGQVVTPGAAFTAPLVAKVTANNSIEPVAGGLITFTSPANGASASLSGTTATIGANGEVSVTAAANNASGIYIVSATATGIATAASFSLANAPTATISAFANNGYTNLTSPQFTSVVGSATDSTGIASVVISLRSSAGKYWNGSSFSSTTQSFSIPASGTTSWTANLPASLSDGIYITQAQASDTNGNTGLSDTATFEVDTTAPTSSIVSGPTQPYSNSSSAGFQFSAADPTVNGVGSGVNSTQYTTNGGITWSHATNPLTLTGLADGAHSFAVRAIDNAGNMGFATATYSWTSDTTAPTTTAAVTSGTLGANGWYTTNTTVTIAPADATSGVAATYYAIDGGSFQTYTGPFSVSGDGAHSVTYYSTDNAGNTQAAQLLIVQVDTAVLSGSSTASAPGGAGGQNPASLLNANFTDSNSLAVASDFTVAAVDWGDGTNSTSGLTVSGSNGNFSVNGSHLYSARGSYDFRITVDDVGGKSAVITGSATVEAYTPLLISPFPNDGFTNLVDPQFTVVTGTVDSSVSVASIAISLENSAGKYWDGQGFNAATQAFLIFATGTTSWTAELPVSLQDDVYTVQAQATETNNTTVLSPSAVFSVDRTAPSTSAVTSGSANVNGWYSANQLVTLSTSDTASGVAATYYKVDSGSFQNYNGPFTVGGDGPHTVTYYSTDNAGNAESPESLIVQIDTTAPTTTAVTSGSANANGWYGNNPQISLDASDATSGVAATYYNIDGGSYQIYNGPFTVSGDGTHTVGIYSTDQAGNSPQSVPTLTLLIDSTAPTASVTSGPGQPYANSTSAQFTFSGSDATSGVASFQYMLDGGAWTTASSPLSLLNLSQGSHVFGVRAIDNAGNIGASSATYSWIVDTASLSGATAAIAQGGTAGQNAAVLSNATFTDSNVFAVASDFTLTAVSWGDGSSDATGLTISGSAGNFTVSGSHLYSAQGSYVFQMTVADSGGQSTVIQGTAKVADAVIVGGLEFTTAGSFAINNGVYTSSQPVLVGYVAPTGYPFTPLLKLAGTTTINESTAKFSNTGKVSAIITGASTTLLSAGFPTNTKVSGLTGGGVKNLTGSSFTVSGSAFTLNTIAFNTQDPGNPQIQLQGSLTLAGGMTAPVAAPNYVSISSSGISLTGVSSPPSSTFSVGGLSMTASNLTFDYNVLTDDLSFSATTNLNVSGLGTGIFDVTGDYVSGALTTLTITLDASSSLSVAGVNATPATTNPITFTYSSTNNQYTVSGGAILDVPGLGSAINVTATGTYSNGSVQSLAFEIATDATLAVGSVTVAGSTANPLTLTFDSSNATLALSGEATLNIPSLGSPFDVTARGDVSNDALQSLDLQLVSNASVSVAGVRIKSVTSNPLTLNYVAAADNQVTFSGAAAVNIPGLGGSVQVNASGAVTSGTLQTLNLALVTGASIKLAGVSVKTSASDPLTLSYLASAENRLTFGGAAKVNVSGLANSIAVTASGVVSSNALQSFALTVAAGSKFKSNGLDIVTSDSLTFGYVAASDSAPGQFSFSGAANVSVPQLSSSAIGVTANGTFRGGALQTLSLTVAANLGLSVAGVTLTTSDSDPIVLTYASNTFDLSGSAVVALPATTGTFTASATGSLVNGALSTLTATTDSQNARFKIGGVAIAPTSLTLTYAQSQVQVSGAANVSFPVVGAFDTTIDATTNSSGLQNFTLTATDASPFAVDGVTVTPTSLSFNDVASSGFTATGSATVSFPTFGSISTTITGAYNNSKALKSLEFAAASTDASAKLDGLTIFPTSLMLHYDSNRGTTLTGAAVFKSGKFGTLATTVSATISDDSLDTLTLLASSGNAHVSLGEIDIDPSSLTFTYAQASGYTIGGTAIATMPQFGSMALSASGAFDTKGALSSFTLTATSSDAQIEFEGATITPEGMTFDYDASTGYKIAGSATVAFPAFGTIKADASGAINRSGALTSLSLTSSASGSTLDLLQQMKITPKTIDFEYANGKGSFSGTAHVQNDRSALLTIDSDVTVSAAFDKHTGSFTTISLAITSLPANTGVALTLGSGRNTPEISGSLSGPLTLSYDFASDSLRVTGNGTDVANDLVSARLSAQNIPGLNDANYDLSFSFIAGAGGLTAATVTLPGQTLSIGIPSAVKNAPAIISASIADPSFSFDATTLDLSVHAKSASITLPGLAAITAKSIDVSFQSKTLLSASIRGVNAGLDLGVGTLLLKNGEFDYTAATSTTPYSLIASGTLHGTLKIPHLFNHTISDSFSLDFSTGNLFAFELNLNSSLFGCLSINADVMIGIGFDLSKLTPDINITGVGSASIKLFNLASCTATLGTSTLPGLTFDPLIDGIDPVEMNIIDLNGSLGIPHVATVTLSEFDLAYDYSTLSLSLTGDASLTLDALGTTSLSGSLGNAKQSIPGIQITNGQLTAFNATINQGSAIGVLGLLKGTAKTDLTVAYSSPDGSIKDGSLTIGGKLSASLGTGSTNAALTVDLTNPADNVSPGLVIKNGNLSSLDATATGTLTLAGVTMSKANLGLQYEAGDNFKAWGSFTASVPTLGSLSISAGTDATKPGFEMKSDGTLVSLSGSAALNFSFAGLSLHGSLGVSYSKSAFALNGSLAGSIEGITVSSLTVGGSFDSGGLESLTFGLSESLAIGKYTLGSVSLSGSYSQTITIPNPFYGLGLGVGPNDRYFELVDGPYVQFSGKITVTLPAKIGTVTVNTSLFLNGNPLDSYVSAGVDVSVFKGTVWLYFIGQLTTTSATINDILKLLGDYYSGDPDATSDVIAVEGPLAGSTIFYDANGNGVLDSGEPFATTANDGSTPRAVPSGSTTGQLVLFGGTDESTNLSNPLLLTAPLDASQVTPLTTLVNDLMIGRGYDGASANAIVDATLNIPQSVLLPYQDVLKDALGGSVDSADAFAAEVRVTSLVSQIDDLLAGLPGAPSAQSLSPVVFNVLASVIDGSNDPLDLSDAGTVAAIIDASANAAGLSIDPELAAKAAGVIAGVNASIDALPVSATQEYLNQVVQAQVVAEGTIAPELNSAAAGTLSIDSVIANNTGVALAAETASVKVGQLDLSGPTIASAPVIAQRAGAGDSSTFDFPVYLTSVTPSTEPITVNYTTEAATAEPGEFTPVSGTLTWMPGDISPKLISVPVFGGSPFGSDAFKVVLSSPSNATIEAGNAVGVIEGTDFGTSTTVTSESGGNAVIGQPETFDATVNLLAAPDASLNSGTVTFYDGSTALGTASLYDNVAQFTTSSLSPGSHNIHAVYNGFTLQTFNDLASTSADIVDNVAKGDQTIAFTSIADQTYGNSPILLAANASSDLPVSFRVVSGPAYISGPFLYITGAGLVDVEATQDGDASYNAAPSVDQTFDVAPAPLTLTVDDQSIEYGAALPTFTVTYSGFVNGDGQDGITTQPTFALSAQPDAVGTYSINASGAVLPNYQITYVPGTFTVATDQANVALSLAPNDAAYGQSVTLTATVTGGLGGGAPTGSITFYDDGTSLGTESLSGGIASLVVGNWTIGSHDVTAVYSGDAYDLGSVSDDQILNVTQSPSSLSLSVTPAGDGAIVTATVSAGAPGSGAPTGTVQFMDGATVLNSVTLANGTASVAVGAGIAPQVSVVYSGDDNFMPGSAQGLQASPNEVSVSLTSSANGDALVGVPITLTADLSAIAAGTDTSAGSVQFLDGTTVLTTVAISNGKATYTADFGIGDHSFTAIFIGANGAQASSPILPLAVDGTDPTITVTASDGTYNGNPYSSSASIAGVLSGIDDTPENTLEGIGLTFDYQLLDANGNFVADLGSAAPVHGGQYRAIASFPGSTNYAPASSSTIFVINQAIATIGVNGYSGAYDGSAHGATGTATGVNGEDLSSLFDFGSKFVDAPGSTAQWTFAGDADYAPASGSVDITIGQVSAHVSVSGYTGVYDGNARGATGTATGVNGEDLSGLLSLGSTSVDVTDTTATWYFAGNADYLAASGSVSVVITPATADLEINGFSGAYDGRAHSATGTATGAGGEDLSGLLDLGSAFVNAPGGTADWSFAGNDDYAPASGEVSITISPAMATIVIDGYTGSYNGNVHGATATATAVNGEDLSSELTISAASGLNAGSYVQTWTFTDTSGNYQDASRTVTDTINPATATIVVEPYDVVYGGYSIAATGTAVGVNGEDLSADLALTGTTHSDVGSYHDTWTFSDPTGNYQDASGAIIDNIGQAKITISSYGVTFDGTTHLAIGNATGVFGEDLSADLDLNGTAHASAGAYVDTWTFIDPTGRYADVSGTVIDTIAQATASISITNYIVTYDGQPHIASGAATGVGGINLGTDLDLSGTAHTDAGTYADTWTFHDPNGNYQDASGTITDNIGKATITVAPYSVSYDGLEHTATATAVGAYGEDLSGDVDLTQTSHTSAGTYLDTWKFHDPNGNYADEVGTVTDDISLAPTTTSVTDGSGYYDGSAFLATSTVTGAGLSAAATTYDYYNVDTDTDLGGNAPTAAGNYIVTATYAGDANHTGSSASVMFTVNAVGSTTTVTADGGTYDGTTAFAATVVVTGPGAITGAVSLDYYDNTTSTDLGNTAPIEAGDYTVTATYPGDANHAGASASATFTVSQATSITTVADSGGTYDGTTAFIATATVSGSGTITGNAILDYYDNTRLVDLGDNAPIDAGNYTVTAAYAGDANHSGSSASVTFTVNQVASNTTVLDTGGIYDGVTVFAATSSVSGSGTIIGDAILNYYDNTRLIDLGANAPINAGSYTVTASYAGDANHAPSSASATFLVGQATASITVLPYEVTYSGNLATGTGTATGVGGVDLSAGLDLSGTTHTSAGNYSDIWTFADPAGNYQSASGRVSDIVDKAEAAITVTPYSMTYDGAAHTATATAVGALGENLNGLYIAATTHTNAGSYRDTLFYFDTTGNYFNSSITITDTIAQAPAIISVTPYSLTYNGVAHTAVGVATGVGGVNLAIGLDLRGTTHTNAGTYSNDLWSFEDPTGNYLRASGTVTDVIKQAIANISVTPYSATYNASARIATGSATGIGGVSLIGGLDLSGTTHTNAGTYSNDPWSFEDPTGNYQSASGTVTDVIKQAIANISVTQYSATYNAMAQTATASATGVGGISLIGDLNLSGTTHTNVGAYSSDPWFFTDPAGNYQSASGTVTDLINKANATITAKNETKVYGTTLTFEGTEFTASGLLGNDSATSVTLTSAGAAASTTLGTYAITPSNAAGSGLANYTIQYRDGTLTVVALDWSTHGTIFVLDPTAGSALSLSGSASVNVTGNIVVDSSACNAITISGAASLKAAGIQVEGGVHKSGSPTFSPQPVTGSQSISDPLKAIPTPMIPSGLTKYGSRSIGSSSSQTLQPGIYSGISVSGAARVTLSAGTYVIEGNGLTASGSATVSIGSGTNIILEGGGLSVSGAAALTGANVTIFNFGTAYNGEADGGSFGPISLRGSGSVSLTPPTSGNYAGILIFQGRDNTKGLTFSGAAMQGTTGMIYAPAAELSESGSARIGSTSYPISIIVDTLRLSGASVANGLDLTAAPGTVAYSPAQIRTAYGLNELQLDGSGQTIAIVDAYDDPNLPQAVDAFDTQFSLTASGPSLVDQYGPASSFLTVLNQEGQATSLPPTDPNGPGVANWELEEALDVEWTHAMAPGARIILVEANSQSLADLMAAIATAANEPGVSVVSMSWGFAEGEAVLATDEATYDREFQVPGVTFVASTGDYGATDPEYPAFSPNVVAVGGTSLTLNADDSYKGETGWGYQSDAIGAFIGSGGGLSLYEPEPTYQRAIQSTGSRTTPDVALVADPLTGAWIADPYNLDPSNPFDVVGGTSLSAPAWAGIVALANQGRVAAGESTLNSSIPTEIQEALYSLPQRDYNAIDTGTNGYNANAGYNLVTGLGTPLANSLVPDLIAYRGIGTNYSGPTVGPLQDSALENVWSSSGDEFDVFSVFNSVPVDGRYVGFAGPLRSGGDIEQPNAMTAQRALSREAAAPVLSTHDLKSATRVTSVSKSLKIPQDSNPNSLAIASTSALTSLGTTLAPVRVGSTIRRSPPRFRLTSNDCRTRRTVVNDARTTTTTPSDLPEISMLRRSQSGEQNSKGLERAIRSRR